MKWRKLIRFINKYRKMGVGHFTVSTNGMFFIIRVTGQDREKNEIDDSLRIPQKFWRT